VNSYSYVANNPLKHIDPTGNILESVIDVVSLSLSINDFKQNPTFGNAAFVGLDAIGLAIPGIPAIGGILKHGDEIVKGTKALVNGVDNASDGVKVIKSFDATAQQQKMLQGIENNKALNTIKDVFRITDEIPGGTMGALRNEILTGDTTKGIFHDNKARNTINRIQNIFKTENLNKIESARLQSISNSLKSLLKNVK